LSKYVGDKFVPDPHQNCWAELYTGGWTHPYRGDALTWGKENSAGVVEGYGPASDSGYWKGAAPSKAD